MILWAPQGTSCLVSLFVQVSTEDNFTKQKDTQITKGHSHTTTTTVHLNNRFLPIFSWVWMCPKLEDIVAQLSPFSLIMTARKTIKVIPYWKRFPVCPCTKLKRSCQIWGMCMFINSGWQEVRRKKWRGNTRWRWPVKRTGEEKENKNRSREMRE